MCMKCRRRMQLDPPGSSGRMRPAFLASSVGCNRSKRTKNVRRVTNVFFVSATARAEVSIPNSPLEGSGGAPKRGRLKHMVIDNMRMAISNAKEKALRCVVWLQILLSSGERTGS